VDRWHYEGTHWHGDADDFKGLSHKAKYFVGGVVLPACNPQPIPMPWPGIMALGMTVNRPVHTHKFGLRFGYYAPTRGDIGFRLGKIVLNKAPEKVKPAKRLGLQVGINARIPPPALQAGLRVQNRPLLHPLAFMMNGPVLRTVIPPPAGMPGLAAGLRCPDAPPPATAFRNGLQMGLTSPPLPADLRLHLFGFKLGHNVTDNPPATEVLLPGFKLGHTITGTPPATEVLTPGFKLGHTVADGGGGGGPPTPGTDCESAAGISVGTSYTYDISPMEAQWFTFPMTAGVTYHLSFTLNSGFFGSAQGKHGLFCASLSDDFTDPSSSSTNVYTVVGVDMPGYVVINGTLFGGGNYTIQVT
jgi:hypothetical protein